MRPASPASSRSGWPMADASRRTRRQYRSLLIGTLALLAILWGLVYLLEVPADMVLALLLGSVMLVGGFALAAFVLVLAIHLVKRLSNKD